MQKRFIIAGPCSAETEEQVLETARQIAAIDTSIIYRAGIWKPRTRPNSFEGIGSIGLQWLAKVKSVYNLRVATEVANAKHVEEALKHDIDILWIGARTTVNPFSVQEIADAVKGSGVSVYIKNPITPDIQLWIGALERIQNAGITDVILIHRGFSTYKKSEYRNDPMWQIPIEMNLKYPGIPLICDVSHILGKRKGLLNIAQKAADIDFKGLMIETHIDPDNALSDAEQQITPSQLQEILKQVIWRESKAVLKINSSLSKLREDINCIDAEILHLLGKRMKITEEIGTLKRENNIPILQIARWNEIITQTINTGKEFGLSEEFIQKYLDAIHLESINKQNNVMSRKSRNE